MATDTWEYEGLEFEATPGPENILRDFAKALRAERDNVAILKDTIKGLNQHINLLEDEIQYGER